jgi:CxxC motif-containing protein (DUF1111 family)
VRCVSCLVFITRGAATPLDLHPGFASATTVLIHRYGVSTEYAAWRASLLNCGSDAFAQQLAPIEMEMSLLRWESDIAHASRLRAMREQLGIQLSQLSPPTLFGVGMLDSIPDDAITALEADRFPSFPEVHGRASRGKDGRVRRFGWKATVTSLSEMVRQSCAVELGLDVPGQHQGRSPIEEQKSLPRLDLTRDELEVLVAYVRRLAIPQCGVTQTASEKQMVGEGRVLFESIGCATCHRPRLASVRGIYSDLLLHKMGPHLSSPAEGYGEQVTLMAPAEPREWRTPPLWDFRNSAPYLHDGRANSLEEAVAYHGGEATKSAKEFFGLNQTQRVKIQTFLRSLVPPP